MKHNLRMNLRSSANRLVNGAAGPISNYPVNVALAARGTLRKYRKGTVLIEEGDKGESVFVINSGRVKVFSVDAQAREITYAVLGAGDYFGEMSLDGGPRSASVITMEAVECSVLTHDQVRAFMAEHPEFAFELLSTVIRRAREATRTARGFALEGAYTRLVAFLENAGKRQPDGRLILEEILTQQEIASRIGCGREMVSRMLKDLAAGGYVTLRARRYVVQRKLPVKW